jgi:hypothetical protein
MMLSTFLSEQWRAPAKLVLSRISDDHAGLVRVTLWQPMAAYGKETVDKHPLHFRKIDATLDRSSSVPAKLCPLRQLLLSVQSISPLYIVTRATMPTLNRLIGKEVSSAIRVFQRSRQRPHSSHHLSDCFRLI